MLLKDTCTLMCSVDYKERFIAEYHQVLERRKSLKNFIDKIQASFYTGKEEPKHDCPVSILKKQLAVMDDYISVLELRASIEEVELDVC